MLVLLNITMESSNLRKKKKGITICNKRTVKCDIEIAQCNNEIVECEKKNKGTIECDKRTVKCDVGTA